MSELNRAPFTRKRHRARSVACFCWTLPYMTELPCGMLPHVTHPRLRDRTHGRLETSPSLQKIWSFFVRSLVNLSGDSSLCCCGEFRCARLFFSIFLLGCCCLLRLARICGCFLGCSSIILLSCSWLLRLARICGFFSRLFFYYFAKLFLVA